MESSKERDDQTIDITPTAAETIDPKRERLAILAEDTRSCLKFLEWLLERELIVRIALSLKSFCNTTTIIFVRELDF